MRQLDYVKYSSTILTTLALTSPHVPEVNWVPLSVVMRAGTPKRATHVVMKASSTVSTSILLKDPRHQLLL